MGGRDHSCPDCGRGGFNDPDGRCECPTAPWENATGGEGYEFGLTVIHRNGEWKVVIDHMGEERAATFCGDLDTALKMALPYIATCCEPDPLAALLRKATR